LDSAGQVYVAGSTVSSDFPGVSTESADSSLAGDGNEGFMAKLDAGLSTILAATFLGGSGNDDAGALALDRTGNVYVAGFTESVDFPGIGAGSADNVFIGISEAFIVELNTDLSTILAATFIGGGQDEGALALALDNAGQVYVTGQTGSSDFPGIGAGSADSTLEVGLGGTEVFVAKLDSNLSAGPPPACELQIVNDQVDFVVARVAFDHTPVLGGVAGTFTITAVLTNIGSEDIQEPIKAVVEMLTNHNLLLSATEGNGEVGSKQAINAGADATLTPEESVIVEFIIGLQSRSPFRVSMDVEGCVAP
jgi:hypothetical protein